VIVEHVASPFRVYFLGFMPRLVYAAGLEPSLYLPRRTQPRVRVPRSSVAIAMDQTTIYPFESPGGWHLIGRTPLWMFDKRREQPLFLAPGDSLAFERIDRTTYDAIARKVEAGTLDWSELIES
jgi:KipI family sensor histidine kinase inhibitor